MAHDILMAAAALLAAISTSAQSIVTVAGGGTADGRPATVVGIDLPVPNLAASVALDRSGNLFIAETENHRIRKVAAGSGIISTVAGNGTRGFSGDGGPATLAALYYPAGLAFDAAGNLYIADTGNNRIRRMAAGSGTISTIAGAGFGFSGDGGPATAATLRFPVGLAIDAAGNLYISDQDDNRIRKVAAGTGIISTVAGNGDSGFSGNGGAATAASLNYPVAVAVDASGNLYIADTYNNRIRKVAADTGMMTTVAGSGPGNLPIGASIGGFSGDGGLATEAMLGIPYGVAVDPSGTLYIADTYNGRIRKVAAGSGVISTIAGNGGSLSFRDGGPATATSMYPSGVALDTSGNIYIVDGANQRVRKVAAANGVISTIAGNGTTEFLGDGGPATSAALIEPSGLATDRAGNLYIATGWNGSGNRIRRVDGDGMITTVAGNGLGGFSGDGGPASAASLFMPNGLAVDDAGNLFIADRGNARIRKIAAASGMISTIAGNGTQGFGGDGGPATAASLNGPTGVALDAAGNLYIADQANNRIRMVDYASGMISTFAGSGPVGVSPGGIPSGSFSGDGGPATAATLDFPQNIAMDDKGNLYIADTFNNRIRRINAGGVISTIAGNGAVRTGSFSGDGGPATIAGLAGPTGVALDAAGNLYVADGSNNRIRKVLAVAGTISTIAGSRAVGVSGDGGPATAAALGYCPGIALNASGDLFIVDNDGNRIRSVPACVTVLPPMPQQPSNASTSVPDSPRLTWSAVRGAVHYDVYLDTANPPATVAATSLVTSSYNPSNLQPMTTYYWKVVAKGDPFCTPLSSASSEVFSFTTTGSCGPPGPFTSSVGVPGSVGETLRLAE